jgi:hypothetical protein
MDLQRRGTGIQTSDPGQPIEAPVIQVAQRIAGSGASPTGVSRPALTAVNVGQRGNRGDDSLEGLPRFRRPHSRVSHTSIIVRGYDN